MLAQLTTTAVAVAILTVAVAGATPTGSPTGAPTEVEPVIIVPGLGGSGLEAMLHDRPPSDFHGIQCPTDTDDWYTLFVSESQVMFWYYCFIDNVALQPCAAETGGAPCVENHTGVATRPIDFGGVNGVEYSNFGSGDINKLPYMHDLITALEAVGYQRNVSLRAATYDFRSAGMPDILDFQHTRLKALVEETVRLNDGRKVHLLSHSLGGPYTNVFLNSMTKEWKADNIASHIMVSAPLLGTPVSLQGLLNGPSYDLIPQFLPELAVPALRTFPSLLWMAPLVIDGTDIWGDSVFLTTPSKNFTKDDYDEMLDVLNATVLRPLVTTVQEAVASGATSPGVPVFCAYANDTKTALRTDFSTDDFSDNGEVSEEDMTWGDGTVNLESLRHCTGWEDVEKHSVYEFGGSLDAHTDIVKKEPLIEDVIAWLGAGN